jgi:hypothetical protein
MPSDCVFPDGWQTTIEYEDHAVVEHTSTPPDDAVGVNAPFPKLVPERVTEPPPVCAVLYRSVKLKTGASNVSPAYPRVPTTAAIVRES